MKFDRNIVDDFIGEAKVKEALTYVRNYANETGDNDLSNNILMLQARNNRLISEENIGIISSENARTEKARISYALFSYISDIKSTTQSTFSNNQNQTQEMNTFSIATLNKFLRDYKDKMYPKTKDTLKVILDLTNVCIIEATKSFEEGTEDYVEIIQPWKNTYSSTVRSGHPDGIAELVEFLISFAESFAHNLEEQEQGTEESRLLEAAKIASGDKALSAIDTYVQYCIKHSVGDEKKQMVIDWDKEKKEFEALTNPFTKAGAIRKIKSNWLN